MITIQKVGVESTPIISNLAHQIWPIAYKNIINAEQINYMLQLMYSEESLLNQIEAKKHQFILAYENQNCIGFASYSPLQNFTKYRLHKLYISPQSHGKGIGKQLLAYILQNIKPLGATHLELNVNKHNQAVNFYKKNGFVVREEEILQIGNGFVMDDYIMELSI